jgi:pimeloyl-ACP methyl ester carboxylesterase
MAVLCGPDGARVSFLAAGAGEPLVLVHSSGMPALQWRRVMPLLAPRLRVLALDLPGYGRTGPVPRGPKVDLGAEAAPIAALARWAGRPLHLVGHSYGGVVALHAALTGAAPLASLTLLEPVAFGVLEALGDAEGLADVDIPAAPLYEAFQRGDHEAALTGFVDYWNGPGAWARLGEGARRGMLAAAPKIGQEIAAARDLRDVAALRALAVPTLLVAGEHTRQVARHIVARLAELLPDARAAVLPGAGHMAPLTHPEPLAAAIAAHAEAHAG